MLKIMGSILVFAAAAGMAGTYKRELADHLALLYALRKLLVDLSCYGNGTRQPVEVLLGCFVRTPDERLNEICRKIADCLCCIQCNHRLIHAQHGLCNKQIHPCIHQGFHLFLICLIQFIISQILTYIFFYDFTIYKSL